jgi:exodeoxyribonuclease V alpha subunit
MSALAEAMREWVLQKTGSRELSRAVALAVDAEAEGHACARLGALGDSLNLAALREQPWVGDGTSDAISPCVLTERGDFYLWRNWRHEQRLAEALMARVGQVATDSVNAAITAGGHSGPDAIDQDLLAADIDLLYAGMDARASRGQREAVAAAVGRRLFVLSGGPGTGKTTTVLRLLLCWLRQRGADFSIALAAPTGKAAQRLSQSMRDGKAELTAMLASAGLAEPPGGADPLSRSASSDVSRRDRSSAGDSAWPQVLARLPEAAQTVHRLLGSLPADDRFRHNAEHPLPHQLIVVDEASMVDLATMRALIEALAPGAALVLVGDPDQLVSVSAGSVLADLVQVAEREHSPLAAHAARLRHVWRAEQELAHAYELVRRGEADALLRQLASVEDCAWHPVGQLDTLAERLQAWMERPEWIDLLAIATHPDHAGRAFAQLRSLQLLSALRAGPWGATELASRIDQALRQRSSGGQWYPGRAIVISHNDYARRLYNGDIGIALGHGAQLRVHFQTTDGRGEPVLRSLSPRELPAHELAFALSVHKSQGSEYDHVAVLLPPDPEHRILTRQLLYTALSRARFGVELWSSEASLRSALARRSQRHGGLRERLGRL